MIYWIYCIFICHFNPGQMVIFSGVRWGMQQARATAQIFHGSEALKGRDASHLCHHNLCSRPSHVFPEYNTTNNARKLCNLREGRECACGVMKCKRAPTGTLNFINKRKPDIPQRLAYFRK